MIMDQYTVKVTDSPSDGIDRNHRTDAKKKKKNRETRKAQDEEEDDHDMSSADTESRTVPCSITRSARFPKIDTEIDSPNHIRERRPTLQ